MSLDQAQATIVAKMRFAMTRQWTKTCQTCQWVYPQRHRLHCLLHLPPLLNSRQQVDQSGTIDCPLDMKMSIPSLYDRWRKTSNRQLYYHGYVSLCASHCGLLQIHLAYSENTFIDPPLIPTLLFLRRTFTKAEELMKSAQHLYNRHHRLILFTETNPLNCS